MAHSSAKKLHKANTQRLNVLRIAILIPTLAYALRWFLFSKPTSTFHYAVFAILTLIYALSFSLIWFAAKPTYSPEGALIDAGHDISQPGMLEYVHDIIYLTVFVQLLMLLTRWALVLYTLVPIFAIYFSCCSTGPSVSDAQAQDPASELPAMTRKERRKAERSARKHRS